MLRMRKKGSTQAQWLGALLIMATLLVSSQGQRFPGLIGCFEAHQNCFQDECQKLCERADFKRPVRGECEADPFPNPYNAVDCCCFVK